MHPLTMPQGNPGPGGSRRKPTFLNWTRERLDTAIACLVADGRLSESDDGVLLVRPQAAR